MSIRHGGYRHLVPRVGLYHQQRRPRSSASSFPRLVLPTAIPGIIHWQGIATKATRISSSSSSSSSSNNRNSLRCVCASSFLSFSSSSWTNTPLLLLLRSQSSLSSVSSSVSVSTASTASPWKTKQSKTGSGGSTHPPGTSSASLWVYVGTLLQRLVASMGLVYVVTGYGLEWTVCEGPSMQPTIQPRGEIILLDRWTPQWYGFAGGGGATIAQRRSWAVHAQQQHQAGHTPHTRKKPKQQALAETEEIERERRRRQQHNNAMKGAAAAEECGAQTNSSKTHQWSLDAQQDPLEQQELQQEQEQEQQPKQQTTNEKSVIRKPGEKKIGTRSRPRTTKDQIRAQERAGGIVAGDGTFHGVPKNRTDPKSTTTTTTTTIAVPTPQSSGAKETKAVSRHDDAITWYEPRIPVNRLPPQHAWRRFWQQLTTGIAVGDVVVLQHPDRVGTVCKRVMGLPGDIVTKPSSRVGAERLMSFRDGGSGGSGSGATQYDTTNNPTLFIETEQDRQKSMRRLQRRLTSGVVIPDGHIWVEGDNAWNSSDSRNYGAVPASLIMGRVVCRLWPIRGHAMMERGERPDNADDNSVTFSGSIVFPVGWDGQRIVRDVRSTSTEQDEEQY